MRTPGRWAARAGKGHRDPDREASIAGLPPDYQPETGPVEAPPPQFARAMIAFPHQGAAGTIIIDTPHTYLYWLVPERSSALRHRGWRGASLGRNRRSIAGWLMA